MAQAPPPLTLTTLMRVETALCHRQGLAHLLTCQGIWDSVLGQAAAELLPARVTEGPLDTWGYKRYYLW